MVNRRRLLSYISVLLLAVSAAGAVKHGQSCPMQRMQVDRLPRLNIPRIGHSVFCINGEVVVVGGHTSGFVPTATAEYYSGGEWHLVPMIYPHDQGAVALTTSGKVLLVGGHEKELGIGQTFTVEVYNPVAHSFTGFGCLENKRCFAKALPMDSGRIVITGNWYYDDCIEYFDGSRQNKFVKPVAQHRCIPYIFKTARDNAIIFSDADYHGVQFDTVIIDRLKGEPFTVPLFEKWRPFWSQVGADNTGCFIGDEKKGKYASLIRLMQGDSLTAIAKVEGEEFSLLPTTAPIPMRSSWGRIDWFSYIVANRIAGMAYIVGYGEDEGDHRIYVAGIDYTKTPAPITLLYSEPQDSIGRYQPVLTDAGDLMLAGGIIVHNNNYDTSGIVLLLHVTGDGQATQAGSCSWLWFIIVPMLLILVIAIVILMLRRRKPQTKSAPAPETAAAIAATSADSDELMERICHYMEEQQPYRNTELKLQDVADALNTNRTYISNCIKNTRGCSFTQFINAYRVEYAKQLLRRHPDKKLSEVWTLSGFSTESSFFRTFKAVTGTTPKDWITEK